MPVAHGRRHTVPSARARGCAYAAALLLLAVLAERTSAFTCSESNDPAICSALGDFYAALGGPNWTPDARAGWESAAADIPTDYCTFFAMGDGGPSCDDQGNFVGIALQYQNLAGTIPTSIGALTSLTAFRISQNGLGGTIPSSLGSLTALTSLKLHENVFTGTIPGELSNLSQLNIVNFGAGNRMQGTLPDQFFAQMSSLTELRMGGLSLSGSIPSSLCSLTSLVFADFSSSGFSGSLPSNIGQLTALTSLLIQANILSGSIPASFSSLTSLTEVVAWGNSITGRIPDTIGSLTSLKVLHFGGCSLTGSVPSSLGSCTSLQELNLAENMIAGTIPPTIGSLTNLVTLQLNQNELEGTLPSTIGSLTSLTMFAAQQNTLTGTLPPTIGSLLSVQEFHVDNNLLSGSIPVEVYSMAVVELIAMCCNQFSGQLPDADPVPPNLQAWDLSWNSLDGTIPSSFGLLATLTSLQLANNQLEGTIPDSLGDLTSLRVLTLNSNQLTGAIPSSVTALELLASSGGLQTSGNNFEFSCIDGNDPLTCQAFASVFYALDGRHWTEQAGFASAGDGTPTDYCTFYGVTCDEEGSPISLSWGSNGLSGTIPDALYSLSTLESLDFSSNAILGTIPAELSSLSSLTYLSLEGTQFSGGGIPDALGSLTALEELWMSDVQVGGSIPSTFSSLTNLVILHLDNMQLHGELPSSLGSLTMLEELGLQVNHLNGSIPSSFGALTMLTLIELQTNDLVGSIPPTLGTLTNAVLIDFSENKLVGTIPAGMCSLTNLQFFALSDNDLSGTIPEFGALSELTFLDFSNNRLTGRIPESCGNLSNIEGFLVATNQLFGEVPISLTTLVTMTVLDLGYNALSSQIPETIGDLIHLQVLLLNNNLFVSPLPESLTRLSALTELRLDSNRLSGQIPLWIASFPLIKSFGLAGNMFTGAIPEQLLNFPYRDPVTKDKIPPLLEPISSPPVTVCPAGSYSVGSLFSGIGTQYYPAALCAPCTLGTIAPNDGASVCMACPANQYAAGDGINCLPCPDNSASPAGSQGLQNCTCSVGYVEEIDGSSVTCMRCPAGTFYDYFSAACLACAPGTVTSSPGLLACTSCAPGNFANDAATSCTPCDPGTFLDTTTQSCKYCLPGSYSSGYGSTSCTPNPPGFASTEQTTFSSMLSLPGVTTFGDAENATLVVAVATTLDVAADAVSITNVSVASMRRRLAAPGTSVALKVQASDPDVASAVRSSLADTTSFGNALTTSLRASNTTSSLAAVATVVAEPPSEDTLLLASQPCAAGMFLDAAMQRCTACDFRLVSLAVGSVTCEPCPSTSARLNASSCTPCPENSRVAPNNPAQCACVAGFYDFHFGVSLTAPLCKACPEGGVCDTGFVAAAKGYWREHTLSDVFYSCREGNCLVEVVVGPLTLSNNTPVGATGQRRMFQLGSSNANGTKLNNTVPENCVEGNTGPLCGLCKPGYALQSGACGPCDPADSFDNWSPGNKAALLVCCIAFALVLIAFAFFQPVVPLLEQTATAVTSALKACFGRVKSTATCGYFDHGKQTEKDAAAGTEAASQAQPKAGQAFASSGEALPTTPAADRAGLPREPSRNAAGAAGTQRLQRYHTSKFGERHRHTQHLVPRHSSARFHGRHGQEHQSATEAARRAAQEHMLDREAAFAVGVVSSTLVGTSQHEDAANVGEVLAADEALDFMDELEELVERLQKFSKIIVNYYQIVSTFLKSLDIPWPSSFGVVMARVNVVNLNLVELPRTACLNPSPSYYKQFNGYTLGLLAAEISIGLLWLLGSYILAPFFLRSTPANERSNRLALFNSTVLSRLLLMLYLVYPGVSVAIFGIFSCSTFESGASYLDADFHITCYDAQHWRYIGAAIFWLCLVTIGIPVFFIRLLQHFKVPQIAQVLADNAWLKEAVQLAWQERMPQPDIDVRELTIDNIGDAHLEALVAFFIHQASAEEATEILAGTRPPPDLAPKPAPGADAEAQPSAVRSLYLRVKEKVTDTVIAVERRVSAVVGHVVHRNVVAHTTDPTLLRRRKVLAELLLWCKTSGELSIPKMEWKDEDEAEERESEDDKSKQQESPRKAQFRSDGAARKERQAAMGPVHSEDLNELQVRAMKEVGFLFAAYNTECWYWETVELLRKLALTSILALIAPGSAGQVVVGMLLAFVMLLANLSLKPYAESGMNFVNLIAQLNLFFLLFVALLLKVNLDGQQNASFFGGLVALLSIIPIALPIVIRVYMHFFGSLEMRMMVKDTQWD